MPIIADFPFVRGQDGTLTVTLTPATSISGWTIKAEFQKRFGGASGLIVKYLASGFAGVSGISLIDGAQGSFALQMKAADTSGLEYGNYSYTISRQDSGFATVLSEGFLLLKPGW